MLASRIVLQRACARLHTSHRRALCANSTPSQQPFGDKFDVTRGDRLVQRAAEVETPVAGENAAQTARASFGWVPRPASWQNHFV